MRLSLFVVFSLALSAALFAAEAPKTFSVGEFNFTRPANWEWVPATSPMRKAELKVESKDKKNKAEVIFFHFGESNGGGTQANVDRWLGQFQEPREKINSKVDTAKINGRTVTFVQAEGTYMSGDARGAEDGAAECDAAGRDPGERERQRFCADDWPGSSGERGAGRVQEDDRERREVRN